MPTRWFLAIATTGLCLTAAIAAQSLPQSNTQTPSTQAAESQKPESTQSGYVLKVTTRLVTLDLIATDSHDKVVRDLKPQDVQVFEEHDAQQKVEQLDFIDNAAGAKYSPKSASAIHRLANSFSNEVPVDGLKIPPTVLLMDGLNTQTANQMQARAHLLRMLQTLPQNTPIAVFLLGSSLKVLQGFTSDGSLLRAAVDHALVGRQIDQDPAEDPNTLSGSLTDVGAENLTEMTQDLQDFEKENYANTMDLRARQTLNALTSIAQYLSGLPGRKNLIWVSEAFPFSVVPSTDTGKNPFAGTRDYAEQITTAANTLTDAQVAVYPVDIRGLEASQVMSASRAMTRGQLGGPQMATQINREQNAIYQSQGTMEALAQDTGGKTCKNTNDLSGCVVKTLSDSSAYYELAFYPQNVNWDGKFHKIVLKTSRPGVKLTYRRGYFALDSATLAKKQPPEDALRQGCSDQLPSTSVHLMAQAAPPGQALLPQGGLYYLLSISAAGLGVSQVGDTRRLNLLMAVCEFGGKNESYRFYERDLTKSVSDEVLRGWQNDGIPDYVAFAPALNTRRVRFVVLDLSTGLRGALDVPVTPADIARAAAPVPPSERPAMLSFMEIPDKEKTPAPPKAMAAVTFHAKSGQSGALDWNGDVLLYRGDLPMDQSATGLFGFAFGEHFHCESGQLVPIDASGTAPVLQFTFHNHSGKVVTVNLKGEHPEYQGDLSVDPSAKSIFDLVWKSSHCIAQ